MTPELCDLVIQYAEYSTERVRFNYSALAPRKVSNPTGFSSAIGWWARLLVDASQRRLLGPDRFIIEVNEELRDALRVPKVGRPGSLGTVVSELLGRETLSPYSKYVSETILPEQSPLSIAARAFSWSASKVKAALVGEAERDDDAEEAFLFASLKGRYVVNESAEDAATRLLDKMRPRCATHTERLLTVDLLHKLYNTKFFPDDPISRHDVIAVVARLRQRGDCNTQGQAVKFRSPTGQGDDRIDANDLSILSLKTTMDGYDDRIARRTATDKSLRSRCGALMASGHKEQARALLRRCQQLDEVQANDLAALGKLQQVLDAIEGAKSNEETMNAMALGAATLKSVLAAPALQTDSIEATKYAMSDALQDADEINKAILDTPIDEEEAAELERELAKLSISDVLDSRQTEEALEQLRAPTTSLVSSVIKLAVTSD